MNRRTVVQQFGQRTRNASTRGPGHRRAPSEAAPVSTARLEAEAAFSALPLPSTPHARTQITVRRARSALLPQADALDDGDRESTPANKGPRVFRVESPPAAAPGPAAPAPPSTGVAGDDAVKASAGRPRRRRVADKRPGPVVHLVRPLPGRADDAPTRLQLAALAAALASIDPTFQAIERARSFVFIDHRFADAWQALSERATALSAEVRTRRPGMR